MISPIGFYVQGNAYFDRNANNMRDEIHKLYYSVKEKLLENDYDVKIANSISDCENADYILSFWSDCSFIINLANNKAKKFFFIFEPPTIRSIEYIKKYSVYFDKIFILYDEIVDNKKFFKIYYPQPNLKMIKDIIDFKDKNLCTMIFTYQNSNHQNELYSRRIKILDFFEKNHPDLFEFYGFGWPNCYKTYKGFVENKIPYLKKYKFAIAYENSRYIGYITEKIFDIMVSGSIPIYLGAYDISKYIPSNCFINRENFNSDYDLFKYIKNMDETEYNQYIKNIKNFFDSEAAKVFSIDNFINNLLIEIKPQKKSDLLVFSFNRPTQLDACLRSINKNISGLNRKNIIYRADKDYEKAYKLLEAKYFSFKFVKQSESFRSDFKNLTNKAIFESNTDYIIFAVDDIIVKDKVDLSYCIEMLEKTNSYGFYLSLGKNIVESYSEKKYSGLPEFKIINDDIIMWQIKDGKSEWRYANKLDMTLYRKKDLKNAFEIINFHDPNSLEGLWALQVDLDKYGICFNESKTINIPINIVRDFDDWSSYYLDDSRVKDFTTASLLKKFYDGYLIDIETISKINNTAPHVEYLPKFIKVEN